MPYGKQTREWDEVQRLIREEAAVLVEVLPTQEYGDEHIQGATNTSLDPLPDIYLLAAHIHLPGVLDYDRGPVRRVVCA